MSSESKKREMVRAIASGAMGNPRPMRQVDHQLLGALMADHGYDQAVLYLRKDGEDGGENVVSAGLGFRSGRVAQDMAEFLRRNVFGMKLETDALDAEIEAAKKEMASTNETGEDIGSQIILPALAKKTEVDGPLPERRAKSIQKRLGKKT